MHFAEGFAAGVVVTGTVMIIYRGKVAKYFEAIHTRLTNIERAVAGK